ncbi:mCG1044130, partial [Mus musculus]
PLLTFLCIQLKTYGTIRKDFRNVLTWLAIITPKGKNVIREHPRISTGSPTWLQSHVPAMCLTNALICDCLVFGNFLGSGHHIHGGTCHSRQSESVSLIFGLE